MLTPLRLVVWLLGLAIVALPTAALVLFLLAVIGSPGGCRDEEEADVIDPALVASFQRKWDQLNATLDAGQTSTITVDERGATARARQWVEEHDAPVRELQVCFGLGDGAASGKVDIPFVPGDVDVVVHGTVDLTGRQPEAVVKSVEIGGLPGPMTDRLKSLINRLVRDQTEEVNLRHDYGISFTDGTATISGQPGGAAEP